jgi:hypothetical protein
MHLKLCRQQPIALVAKRSNLQHGKVIQDCNYRIRNENNKEYSAGESMIMRCYMQS